MAFRFPMAFWFDQDHWKTEQNGSNFVKKHWKWNKIAAILFQFAMVLFSIGADQSKTEPLET